jgi:hypothetical protein
LGAGQIPDGLDGLLGLKNMNLTTFASEWAVDDRGFHRELIKRSGDVAMYRRWKDDPAAFHWEVVYFRWYKESLLPNGRLIPAGKKYPRSSKWGVDGFTYLGIDLAGAEQRFTGMASSHVAPNAGINPRIKTIGPPATPQALKSACAAGF